MTTLTAFGIALALAACGGGEDDLEFDHVYQASNNPHDAVNANDDQGPAGPVTTSVVLFGDCIQSVLGAWSYAIAVPPRVGTNGIAVDLAAL